MKRRFLPGYTLIEMIVVAGLIGLLSVGIVAVFISTMQGSKRAKLQATIKVQGDYVITSMERTIRNSVKVPTCLLGGKTITFLIKNAAGTFETVEYSFNDTEKTLQSRVGSGSLERMINSNDISVVDGLFTCVEGNQFDMGTVGITIELQYDADPLLATKQTFQTTVALRAIP